MSFYSLIIHIFFFYFYYSNKTKQRSDLKMHETTFGIGIFRLSPDRQMQKRTKHRSVFMFKKTKKKNFGPVTKFMNAWM